MSPEIVACPEPTCQAPAEVADAFVLASTSGPVTHLKTSCLQGHHFTLPQERVLPLPVAPARPAARIGR